MVESDSSSPPSSPSSNLKVSASILQSEFCQTRASKSLRVTCYGSSASQTPPAYLQEAFHAGYLLARRGHVCVNGAGSCGCMAAMNDGASLGNGHIVGVIHEMWLVDGGDALDQWGVTLRDGGAHGAFAGVPQSHGGPHKALTTQENDGPIREMLIAGGKDLQERKRLLVDKSDALLVLPGGPGTWDELWEMACARNIGLTTLPIVLVNTNGYYDNFRSMLERAYNDHLTKLEPDDILHFEDTAEEAIRWIEATKSQDPKVILKKRAALLRSTSILSTPVTSYDISWFSEALRRASSWLSEARTSFSEDDIESSPSPLVSQVPSILRHCAVFGAGIAVGILFSLRNRRR